MQFRLLGPVEICADDGQLRVGSQLQQRLVAALVLRANRVVGADHLIDLLWDARTARAGLQGRVSHLRRVLAPCGPDRLQFRPPGYLLRAAPGERDIDEFRRQAEVGRQSLAAGDAATASHALRAALALWRGPALHGVDGFGAEVAKLEESRLAALEDRIEADMRLGRHSELVAELEELADAEPLRERPHAQLMLALYRSGRPADTLAVFRSFRDRLVEELGLEPSPSLRQLHQRILAADAALAPPTVVTAGSIVRLRPASDGAGLSRLSPSQLPPAANDLTGREGEVAGLRKRLLAAGMDNGPVVCAVYGTAGSGKTALAVRVGQDVRSAFPDGQLFVNLRGVDPKQTMGTREVLGGFLRALGMDTARLPDSVTECAAIYRSLLVGRQVLVVLDDAGSEDQVRLLSPNQPGCAALVTSRAPLSGLEGATQLGLSVLDEDLAVLLLGRLAGSDRVDAEPETAREIVRLCGCLPLAVRIAGARLAARQQWPLRVLAARLGDERRRLDELTAGDLEVRASIELSYRGLGERERRGFRLLGVLGVPEFAPRLLGPLLDESVAEVEGIVERLVDAQLLDFHGVDDKDQLHYRFHDLVRLFASECGEADDSPDERAMAVGRVLRYWLTDDLPRKPREWFEGEQGALVIAIERAGELGLDDLCCDLAAALASSWFRMHNRFEEWQRTHSAALAVARRTGNLRCQALMLCGLGQLRYEQDRFGEADDYFLQALGLSQRADDRVGRAIALAGLGSTRREQSRFADALAYLDQAIQLFRDLGDRAGIADVAYEIGVVFRELGQFTEAMAALDEALVAYRAVGKRREEGLVLRSIGLVHRAAGELLDAELRTSQALEIFRDIGDRLYAAYGVQALAKVHVRQGRGGSDLESLTDCLTVFRELRDRFGEGLALRTLGELHLAEGALDAASRCFNRALHRWQELRLPLFRARTLRDIAELHRRRGDLATSGAFRQEALDVFRHYGSRESAEMLSAP